METKKKVICIFIAVLMIFCNPTYVFAESDVTPPVVNGMTWSASELKTGDKLNVEIDASDLESGISENSYDNYIVIMNEASKQKKLEYLTYDKQTKKFKCTFNITSDMPSGEWVLDFVTLNDKARNEGYYHDSNFGKEYKVNITTETKDVTPPVVSGMTWSASELKAGDKLNVEIDASDSESGISENSYDNYIVIINRASNQRRDEYLTYDKQTKKFKCTFNITSDMPSGEWVLDFVTLNDKTGNEGYYHDSNFGKEYKVNITTETKDVTPPVVSGMTWSASELKAGDKLNVEIDASDSESGISENSYDNYIVIINRASNQRRDEYLTYDKQTKKFKCTFNITSDMPSGEWILDFVTLNDKARNEGYYHDSDFGKEYKVNIKSVFTGTDNKAISVGSTFNPLDGVTAESNFEGDFTKKVTYSGNVDTSKEGIYLIKYEAIGKNGDVYRDYRWITVNSKKSDNTQGIYFNNDVKIDTSNLIDSSSMNITKDGLNYDMHGSDVVSDEGKYTVSFKSCNSSNSNIQKSSRMPLMMDSQNSASSSGIQPSSLEFTIDKTSPKITSVSPQTIDEDDRISADKFVTATDNNNNVKYNFLNEPNWSDIGNQNVEIEVTDSAGNVTLQKSQLTIIDKCDLNRNGSVDIKDLANEAQGYNMDEKSLDWNKKFDFNKDGKVDIYDLVILSKRMIL